MYKILLISGNYEKSRFFDRLNKTGYKKSR
jgi:hypothetical protein